MLHKVIQYCKDLRYAYDEFETGFSRSDVYKGFFTDNDLGQNQEILYQSLLENNFKETRWQLVFPNQNAGLIRKISPAIDGMNEIHVRFYEDGEIGAELEYGRFSPGHWRKKREDGAGHLEKILIEELVNLSAEEKTNITNQITNRNYNAINPEEFRLRDVSIKDVAWNTFLLIQYPLSVIGAGACLSQGDYHALEYLTLPLIETPFIINWFSPERYTRIASDELKETIN